MYIDGDLIKDDAGRTLILRGCNLGGGSKLPAGADSFIGRPFPPDEAEDHFERLRRWGFHFCRFVITWEALEHDGPGVYDEAYLAFLRKILLIAEKKGISVFMDPHQDAWSRWTGGDGAPAWTLDMLGIDRDRLDGTGAAVTERRYGELHGGAPYPPMIWPVNYNRYAAATLFTLFFAGNTYAPDCRIGGESVQDYLQEKYIACMRHCYRRLKNCAAITGWGTMNEPHQGFIGYHDCEGLENYAVAAGPMPSPFQAMQAASGFPVDVPVYHTGLGGRKITGSETLNRQGLSLFKEGSVCPWEAAGVWTGEGGKPRLLRKDHFAPVHGRPVSFTDEFLKPFCIRFIRRMREANEKALFFIEGIPHGEHPSWSSADAEAAGPVVVHAFHHYDGLTLFTRQFRPWLTADPARMKLILGRKKTAAFYASRLAAGIAWSRKNMGNIPCLLGEFGLPFNLNRGRAFKTGDYRLHEEALSLYYDGIDRNLLHATIWNYTADNTHAAGDGWNGEDLSIFGEGKPRALGGWLRPYPVAAAGKPLFLRWNRKKGLFRFRFLADSRIAAPTEIYLPAEWFGQGFTVKTSSGPASSGKSIPEGQINWEYKAEAQRLSIRNTGFDGELEIQVQVQAKRVWGKALLPTKAP